MDEIKKIAVKLSEIYGGGVRVLGPYLCKDGRKRVDVSFSGKTTTHQLARVKLEVKLGRKLTKDETVDHIDEDKTNNSYSNLQVLTLSKNAEKAIFKVVPVKFICAHCGSDFFLSRNQRGARDKVRAGPFCSRSCCGKYGKSIQMGAPKKKRKKLPEKKYYR